MNQPSAQEAKSALAEYARPDKAKALMRFFRTGPGQYGEGDQFVGIMVPDQRVVAKRFKELPHSEISKLLESPVHEHRLTGLFILIHQFERGKDPTRKQCYQLYLDSIDRVNNWDLVDSSAHKIMGRYLYEERKPTAILDGLARSPNLWRRRIAMIATAYYVSQDSFEVPVRIAEQLLHDEHDLIHKAVGWMLREIGKRDQNKAERFLKKHYKTMPRTMLRYAIERFPEKLRQRYLKGTVQT